MHSLQSRPTSVLAQHSYYDDATYESKGLVVIFRPRLALRPPPRRRKCPQPPRGALPAHLAFLLTPCLPASLSHSRTHRTMRSTLLAAALVSLTTVTANVLPITKTGKFLYDSTGARFFIKVSRRETRGGGSANSELSSIGCRLPARECDSRCSAEVFQACAQIGSRAGGQACRRRRAAESVHELTIVRTARTHRPHDRCQQCQRRSTPLQCPRVRLTRVVGRVDSQNPPIISTPLATSQPATAISPTLSP